MVLLASSDYDLQHALEQFATKCEAAGMRINTSKSEAMVHCQQTLTNRRKWMDGLIDGLWGYSYDDIHCVKDIRVKASPVFYRILEVYFSSNTLVNVKIQIYKLSTQR